MSHVLFKAVSLLQPIISCSEHKINVNAIANMPEWRRQHAETAGRIGRENLISERLKRLRAQRNLSQRDLAYALQRRGLDLVKT